MANATGFIQAQFAYWDDLGIYWPLSAVTHVYYVNEMIGVNTAGNADTLDDTQALQFLGTVIGSPALNQNTGVAGGLSVGGLNVQVIRPMSFSMKIAAAAAGDTGRPCFAKFNNEVQYVPGAFGNFVGTVRKVISATEVEIMVPPWTPATVNSGILIATLTGDVNDYAPTGYQFASQWRLTLGAARNMTGIKASYHGRRIQILNVDGTNALTLKYNSGSSVAANRITATGLADVVVAKGGAIDLVYDGLAASGVGAWQVLLN